MKKKIVTIVLGSITTMSILAGCQGAQIVPVSQEDTQTNRERELQSELDAVKQELDQLKNTQNGEQTGNEAQTQNGGQEAGKTADGAAANTNESQNGQPSGQTGGIVKEGNGQTAASAYRTTDPDVKISLEEAKQIALAKVPGATENSLSIHLDFDDGYWQYEGDIWHDRMEYEFDIDANTGNILKWEQEMW